MVATVLSHFVPTPLFSSTLQLVHTNFSVEIFLICFTESQDPVNKDQYNSSTVVAEERMQQKKRRGVSCPS